MISHPKVLIAVLAIDCLVISLALTFGKAASHFGEAGLVTVFSFYQLFVIAAIAWKVHGLRKTDPPSPAWKGPPLVWLLMAVGFVFLSVDELAMIHEYTDKFIHYAFHLKETGLTDGIDDVLVGCYGLIGLVTIYIYRVEMKVFRAASPLFKAGFVFFFIMVAVDILNNRNDLLRILVADASRVDYIDEIIDIVEEILKIIAEGVFVAAFYKCYTLAWGMNPKPDKR